MEEPQTTTARTTTRTITHSDWLNDRQFGIVLDAGSSGTRIQVYSWKSPRAQLNHRVTSHQSTRVLPRIETGVQDGNDWQLKVEPGISSFGSHPHHLGQYLKPLLDHALKLIPANQIATTPFYLLATAGMRLLPQLQQDGILEEVCSYIKTHYRFRINQCSQHIQIISGEEEGTFGWVAVNYLMDGFDRPGHPSTGSQASSTFGFLDMGGASTQIAFEPNELAKIEHADNLTKLTLKLLDGTDISHSVFVTTWLGYGTNKARERYAQKLLEQFSSDHQIRKPNQLDQLGIIPDPCLPASLLLPSPSSSYQFNGTGDFKKCIQNVSPLLNKNAPCLDEPCLFDGKHVPPIDFSVNRFIGISEYWYSTQDLWSMGGIYDFVEFEKKAISYCQLNWEEIIESHKSGTKWPSNVEISRLETQCFKAAWIINILHEGIGIPRIIDKGGQGDRMDYNQEGIQKAAQKGLLNPPPPNFQSLNEVGNITVSWTLGKMVLEISQQLSSSPQSTSSIGRLPGIHTSQLGGGLKAQLSHAKSWIEPMAILGMTLGALVIWFLYSCSKTLCQFQKERRLGGQGYVLASMEEGDGGRRDSNHTRPSTPRVLRKPSLSSPRSFFHSAGTGPSGLIQQTVSRALGVWTNRSSNTPVHRSLSASHPSSPRAGRPSRLGSPNQPKFSISGGYSEGADDEDQKMLIPPVSITTSLSAPAGGTGYQSTTSSRTSVDEGLFNTVPISRTGSSSGTKRFNDDWTTPATHHQLSQDGSVLHADHLFPLERPKFRFSHSKSFQSLSSPSDHQLDDHLDYRPPSSHDRSLSSAPHEPLHSHQHRTINSHSCSNLTDYS
ncbi:Golgi apyrase [Puccinia graminis f. sp. tritici]|uniref:Golgi apyrase n=1 Tax=Puccinia graminis f. sp. tritici TaxID=56615 RepID=A0A5B0NC20_PUCGR|nr:Golgi apyrase [Puccinia graminis f. sp. tritici]